MKHYSLILIVLSLFSLSLFAETAWLQSFESSSADTWNYIANPTPESRLIWWGSTSETMGGASAYQGSYYWAGWDLDNVESTLTFSTQTLQRGYTYQLSFWYYTRNLAGSGDYCRYSVKYDNGITWDNWITVNNNSNAWTMVTIDIPAGSEYLRLRLSSKFDGATKYAHWDYIKVEKTAAASTAPVVSNVSASQRTDGSKLIDIWYDLYDAEGDLCDISVKISADSGNSWSIIPAPACLSGDFGDDLSDGNDKHIVWDAGAQGVNLDGSYLYRVFADDGTPSPVPENFVLVEGGTFHNGTSNVTVSSFFIDKYELTQGEYEVVMGNNPSYFGGNPSHPVEQVTWYNVLEYCNRRSLQEGLTPCYSYGTYGTNPSDWPSGWNSSNSNHTNVSCSWTANGYRLPTEMEWMFAAKGGNQSQGYTYSGSNTIGDVAWYNGNNSPNGTKLVGGKLPNELGLYDMSGNVWEWCWDIYGDYPGGAQTNPHGATSGSYRMIRGGSWVNGASICTVSFRYNYDSTYSDLNIGFRCLRVSP